LERQRTQRKQNVLTEKLFRIQDTEAFKTRKDLTQQNIFERFGIGVSEGEQAVQRLQEDVTTNEELAFAIQDLGVSQNELIEVIARNPEVSQQPELIREIISSQGQATSSGLSLFPKFDISKSIPWILAGVVGLALIAKK